MGASWVFAFGTHAPPQDVFIDGHEGYLQFTCIISHLLLFRLYRFGKEGNTIDTDDKAADRQTF